MKQVGVKGVGKEPKSGHMPPAGPRGNASAVGNERKADMAGAMMGQPTDGNPLRGAMKHLASEHPEKHDDRGPHRGGSAHMRHMPHPYSGKGK